MKKYIAIGLAVVLVLVLSASVAAAPPNKQTLTFDMDWGYWQIWDPYTDSWESVDATANFSGVLTLKGDRYYLTPLTGTITTNNGTANVTRQIVLKSVNQSDPIGCQHYEYSDAYSNYTSDSWWNQVIATINGKHFVGMMFFTFGDRDYVADGDYHEEYCNVGLEGVVDGKLVKIELERYVHEEL